MADTNKITVPLSADDVTPKWILQVMAKSLGKPEADLEVATLEPIADNAGLMSETFRAKVVDHEAVHNLFIKISLPKEDPWNAFIASNNIGKLRNLGFKDFLIC